MSRSLRRGLNVPKIMVGPTTGGIVAPLDDPQLAELFAEEIRERAERLVDHARSWAGGDWREETAEEAQRDAHTIKGNAAFVGDESLSEAASLLEKLWSGIRSGARSFSEPVADALVAASVAVHNAASRGEREPEALALACEILSVENPFAVDGLVGERDTLHALAADLPDLGGLVEDEVPHFLDEISPINSERFGKLVDAIAEQRLDTEALIEALQESLEMEGGGEWRAATTNLLESVRDLFNEAAALTLTEASQITSTLGQLVRYIARRSGKDVDLIVEGGAVEADRYILDVLREPIRHLVVNAVEHGIERPAQRLAASKERTGTVRISFADENDILTIAVADDGRGISWGSVARVVGSPSIGLSPEDLTEALLGAGFTTLEVPTQFSGDGAGLELVARTVAALDGSIGISSSPSDGTTVLLRVPRLRAMQMIQVISTDQQRWGLPAAAVIDVLELAPGDIVDRDGQPCIEHGSGFITFSPLGHILGGDDAPATHAVIVATAGTPYALGIVGAPKRTSGVAKQLGKSLGAVDLLSGAALLGGGDFVAMLDTSAIGRAVREARSAELVRSKIVVVDDSRAARQLLAASLTSAGFRVATFGSAEELLGEKAPFDADVIVTDIEMPDYDGFALIRELRKRGFKAPIAALSGAITGEALDRAISLGADMVFEKADLRQGGFVEAVRQLVKDSGESSETQTKEPT